MSNAYGSEVTKRLTEANRALNPLPEMHPRFLQAASDVRSGRKTVDQAWSEWVTFCEANGLEPVNNKRPKEGTATS